jgi:hypothetical protein
LHAPRYTCVCRALGPRRSGCCSFRTTSPCQAASAGLHVQPLAQAQVPQQLQVPALHGCSLWAPMLALVAASTAHAVLSCALQPAIGVGLIKPPGESFT